MTNACDSSGRYGEDVLIGCRRTYQLCQKEILEELQHHNAEQPHLSDSGSC